MNVFFMGARRNRYANEEYYDSPSIYIKIPTDTDYEHGPLTGKQSKAW